VCLLLVTIPAAKALICVSGDTIGSADSSTNTIMLLDQRGRDFRDPQRSPLVASVLLRQSVRGQGSTVQQPADRLQDVRVEGAVDVPEEGEGVARVAEERA